MICALGLDPGGTTGLFLGGWQGAELVLAVTREVPMAGAAAELADLLEQYRPGAAGLEAWDGRRRGARLRGFSAAAQHALIAELGAVLAAAGIPHATWQASAVKNWADDRKLEAAGLLAATAGTPDHGRDAARVCCYTACYALGLPDPLSGTGRAMT